MIISRKRCPLDPEIVIGGNKVERVQSYKLLGVTITEDLSWSLHISKVCVRGKSLLGCLYRGFHLAGTMCLAKIYKAVIRPILEYAACVWSPHHRIHQDRLERVQSFAAKVVPPSTGLNPPLS